MESSGNERIALDPETGTAAGAGRQGADLSLVPAVATAEESSGNERIALDPPARCE